MQTRKDLLQAHRLMTQRAAMALILGEPDNPELPLRRLNVAAFCGVMVALLVTAAFGIYGLIRPGGATGLQKSGMLIVEKETGARYVWCQSAKLCPVTNYVSARLLAGSDASSRRTVSRESLTGFQRGPEIGIPGAPDNLPDARDLVKLPWSVCVRAVDTGAQGIQSMVTLVAGSALGGRPYSDDQALVVQADNQAWLIWKSRRLRVPGYAVPLLSPRVAQVSAKWLNALPQGPDFQAPAIPGRGQPAPAPGGSGKAGQLYTAATGSGTSWYVLLPDGLAPISDLEKELLRADPQTRLAYGGQSPQPNTVDPAAVAGAAKSRTTVSNAALQGSMPRVQPYQDTVPLCATYDDRTGNSAGQLVAGATLPAPPTSVAAAGVDQTVFPPGGAALVGLLPQPGKASGITTYYLVTDGRRFALKSPTLAATLGYDITANAIPIPAGVLELLPAGPVIDPDAAANPVPVTQPGG